MAVPTSLEGKDVLARSGTGTGKTAAYLLPVLDHALRRNEHAQTIAIILTPTKELASQVTKVAKALSVHCPSVRITNISGKQSSAVEAAHLADAPSIVVGTPGRIAANVNSGALSLKNLAHLVVDEADLVLGYGFKDDIETIAKNLQGKVQTQLFSATLNPDLETLKGLLCRDPVVIKLDDDKDANLVKQFVIKCAEDEKYVCA